MDSDWEIKVVGYTTIFSIAIFFAIYSAYHIIVVVLSMLFIRVPLRMLEKDFIIVVSAVLSLLPAFAIAMNITKKKNKNNRDN